MHSIELVDRVRKNLEGLMEFNPTKLEALIIALTLLLSDETLGYEDFKERFLIHFTSRRAQIDRDNNFNGFDLYRFNEASTEETN